jgi:hypothetical protein
MEALGDLPGVGEPSRLGGPARSFHGCGEIRGDSRKSAFRKRTSESGDSKWDKADSAVRPEGCKVVRVVIPQAKISLYSSIGDLGYMCSVSEASAGQSRLVIRVRT